MLKLYFLHTICHNSKMFRSILIHLQAVTEHQEYLYKNIDGLLNTLKFCP